MAMADLLLSDVHLGHKAKNLNRKIYSTNYDEHAVETTLDDVGLQLWNGGVLMCEFILSHKDVFENKSVFEFGSGLGLSSVCLAAVQARRIFATDLNSHTLRLAEHNYTLNSDINLASRVTVTSFLQYDWSLDFSDFKSWKTNSAYGWTELLISEAKLSDIFLAADVIYDVESAELFYERILSLGNDCDHDLRVFISLEKRYNFTMEEMNVSCPYYDRFSQFLKSLPPNYWKVIQWDIITIPKLISTSLEFGRNGNMMECVVESNTPVENCRNMKYYLRTTLIIWKHFIKKTGLTQFIFWSALKCYRIAVTLNTILLVNRRSYRTAVFRHCSLKVPFR